MHTMHTTASTPTTRPLAAAIAIALIATLATTSPASAQGLLDRLRSVASGAAGDAQGEGWRAIERHVERHKDRNNPLMLRATTREHRRVEILTASRPGVYAVHEGDELFPVTESTRVRVKDADPETDHIEIDIESSDGREGRISFYGDAPTVTEFRVWMDEIFATETPERDFERYFADTLTNVLHARGSEHQVPTGDRVGYRTLAEAEAHDHHRCMVCFYPPPRVSEWDVEEELQRAGLEQARREYRVVPNRSLQTELQRLGERILSQWPAPLKGYGYEFTLVDHPMINAFAVPGGRIFVSTGLVGALETEAALQAVLAHEIAHVESRHSYRGNKGVQTAEAIGGLLDLFSRTTGNRGVAEAGALATNGIGNVVLANYGREREREADMFASVFFARANQGTEGLAGTFEALRDAEAAMAPSESRGIVSDAVDNAIERMLASHPSVTERLERARGTVTGEFPESAVFHGVRRNGERVATLRFELQQAYDDELNVLANIVTTEALGRKDNVNDIDLWTASGRRIHLDEQTAEEVEKNDNVSPLFSTDDANGLIEEPITELSLKLRNVDRWVRANN